MPPLPSDAESRPPEDFAPLLARKSRPSGGRSSRQLVGMYYGTRTAALAPFVSRDVDVLGDRETLAALGKLAGTKPQFFSVKRSTNEIGVVIARDHTAFRFSSKCSATCMGSATRNCANPFTPSRWANPRSGASPIALLQAKIAKRRRHCPNGTTGRPARRDSRAGATGLP